MAISRSQLVKELEPGLNALFGLEYRRYDQEHKEIYATESSDRAFEEEVMLSGFANADVKPEGQGVAYDEAQETFTARYTMETVAFSFRYYRRSHGGQPLWQTFFSLYKSFGKIYGKC